MTICATCEDGEHDRCNGYQISGIETYRDCDCATFGHVECPDCGKLCCEKNH